MGLGQGPISNISSPAAYFAGPAGSAYATSQIALPRGQGTGPAEVNLLPLFRTAPGAAGFLWNNYATLLSGGNGIMGRYGPMSNPNAAVGSAVPGVNGSGVPLTLNTSFPFNGIGTAGAFNGMGNYWANFASPGPGNAGIYDSFGSPPDHQTLGEIGLDRAGRPLYISMGGPVANGPYDLDITRNAPHAVDIATVNDPYGLAELERILRYYDRDAGTLPQRLANITNNGNGSILQFRRAEFTTVSAGVPVAAAVLPPALRANLPGLQSVHPVDILSAKLPANIVNNPSLLYPMRMQLLPWEILQGLKMDLNRPFGAVHSPPRATAP